MTSNASALKRVADQAGKVGTILCLAACLVVPVVITPIPPQRCRAAT